METDYKEILLQLVASLTLAEDFGDVSESIDGALRKAGFNAPKYYSYGEEEELTEWLIKQGVTTLWGTELSMPEDYE